MTADELLAYEDDAADALSDDDAALDGFDDLDALAALDEFDDSLDLDALDEDGFDDLGDLDALDGTGFDALADLADEEEGDFNDFALDGATGLYLPQTPTLITGPAAIAAARRINPVVLASLSADDSDAFFRRALRRARRIARGVGRIASRVGAGRIARIAGGVLRRAAPLLRRAAPFLQRVVRNLGPWGSLTAAGIGAVQGLASGRGLRGALAGAIGGAIPGIGGRLASMVLRGDGADDDAALDALADMADAGQVPGAVALPVGVGLVTRMATRNGLHRLGSSARVVPQVWPGARQAERMFLAAAARLPGSAGQRLRLLRLAGRGAAQQLGQQPSVATAVRALPAVARRLSSRLVQVARRAPGAGAVPRAVAIRRMAARQRLLRLWLQRLLQPARVTTRALA